MKYALIATFPLFLMVALATAEEPLVPAGWDAALAGDQVLERLIPVTGKQVKGAHDAEMVLVDNQAFIVAEVNDTRAGESAGWPEIYCALSIVNLKTLKVEAVIPLARSGQKYENETLPVGACFVPRILQHDENTLRCFFASEQPGKRQAQNWYIDFNITTRAFENKIHKLKLKTAAGRFDMQPQYFHADAAASGFRKPAKDYGLYLFDSFKNWGDQTYIAINNFAGKQNALARINEQHDTIEVLGHYNEPQSVQLSESAVNRLPDGTWMAICRNDGGNRNYYFTTSQDGQNWTEGATIAAVPNGTNAKPTFDKFGEVYYLGWQEVTRIDGVNRSVFNIDVSRDGKIWQRKYRFETSQSFQYPAFAEYKGAIWLCVTQGDSSPSRKERIMFGKLEETGEFVSQAGMQRRPKPKPVDQPAIMQPGVKLFTDRQYTLQEVPGLLKGLHFLKTTIEGYEAVCKAAGTLYALTPARRPGAAAQELDLIRQGFEKMDLPEFPLFPGEINRVTIWQKQVKQGDHLRFQKLVLLVMGSGTRVAMTEATPRSKKEKQAEIKNMERLADLALVPPVVNTSPLPEYDYDKLDYGMTIGIERTRGGRLWACWVAGGDSPKAFFVLAFSDDDGAHWSRPRVVLDSHSPELPIDRSILVGNLWTDPLGRLWLIFDQSLHMFDGRAGVWATVCENPDATDPQWSEPRRIWHGVTLNKPTVLSNGEWMLPISLDQRSGFGPFKGCFHELDPQRGANVFVSTDQGATWQRRGAATFSNPDWHEHMIIERKDGSLWMLARTAKGIMQTTSTDGGRTWAPPSQPPQIRHPNARFHIRRLASGRLLLVKHGDQIDAHQGRVQLSAWLSDDDGMTWQGGLVIDERKGISYPDGFQAPDGSIYISYDRNRSTDGEILLAKFTEQDILAKKLISSQSKLKQLISKATHAEKVLKQKPE